MFKRLTSLCCLLLLFAVPALAKIELEVPQRIKPYDSQACLIRTEERGLLSLYAIQSGVERQILKDYQLEAGENTWMFDGLLPHGEPMRQGQWQLRAAFEGSRGREEALVPFTVGSPKTALQFALAARNPVTAEEGLEVDYMLSTAGRVEVRLLSEKGQLLKQQVINVGDTPRVYRWDCKVEGKPAEPGQYELLFSAVGTDRPPLSVPFTLTTEKKPDEVSLTTHYLPEGMDKQSLIEAFRAPLTVVNIGATSHQAVYSAPNRASKKLGEVHGQTAGLYVMGFDQGFAYVGAYRHEDGEYIKGYVPLERLKTVYPQGEWGLLIDKQAQRLTLYQEGEAVKTWLISTGLIRKGKLFRETHAGAYLFEKRIPSFGSEGFTYNYPIRIDGGNFIHELGWKKVAGTPSFDEQLLLMGSKASHGCVRVDCRTSGDELSMYWIWANLPRNTKVLVLDDPAERREAVQKLLPMPEALPTATPLTQPSGDTEVLLSFGGDCVLSSDRGEKKEDNSFENMILKQGMAYPLQNLKEIFGQDDLSLVNLECVLHENEADYVKAMHNFRGLLAYTEILTQGSVEAVNVANNHIFDYGRNGKKATLAALNKANIRYSGYRATDVFEKDGVRIGFAGIRETIYKQTPGQVNREIEALRAQGCHYIVYSMHFGTEYEEKHNALQEKMARAAIDAGANLVIGTHPHVVQGIETYKQGLILYSLGNLVFGGNRFLTTFDGLVAQVNLSLREGQLAEVQLSLVPVMTSGDPPRNDFSPRPAAGEDEERILSKIQQDTPFPLSREMTFILEENELVQK